MSGPSIAIALFEGVEELDWVGPWEVLGAWARMYPGDDVSVFTVAETEGVVRCANGARVLADHMWEAAPSFDVLIWPGGQGTRRQLGVEAVRALVRGAARAGVLMASVCTGSLVYADAGLLDGRPATTHWGSLEHLATLGRSIEVRPDDRFVDDVDVITAAGVSAGIDMALHLVRRLHSNERADEVRRYIQYDPEPLA
ncbi:MAG: DJ-1/PfpI family protein [Actinomycetota bacterium]|nr:DJ-1/PfpI family protein [Actinomycetota bacterium]